LATRIGVGLDDSRNGVACGKAAARQARAELGLGRRPAIALALVFTSHKQPDAVLRGVNAVLGRVPITGVTAGGQYTHQGYVEHGAGVMLIHSDRMQFHLSVAKGWSSGQRLFAGLQGITGRGLGSPYKHRTLIIFPEDETMNLDGVVDTALTETALMYDILGGPGLTAMMPPRPPAVFINREVVHAGLTSAEVLSERPLGLALANGWEPVSDAHRITQSDDRRIVTIDGRPALETYQDFLDTQGVQYRDVRDVMLHYPVGVCQEGDCKVSLVMGIEADGALRSTSPPTAGSVVRFLATRSDAMIAAATRAIKQAYTAIHPHEAAGALFIDCVSTGMVLEDAYAQQQAAARSGLGDVPFLGFRSHGVLARLPGQLAGHYECTVGTCIIPA